jgi:formate/nitrite transporter FocA (FNT family)
VAKPTYSAAIFFAMQGDRPYNGEKACVADTAADFPALTWADFLLGNLMPVTIGNIIGGSVMVAAVVWFVYLRKK